jgi:hypothetical protein
MPAKLNQFTFSPFPVGDTYKTPTVNNHLTPVDNLIFFKLLKNIPLSPTKIKKLIFT